MKEVIIFQKTTKSTLRSKENKIYIILIHVQCVDYVSWERTKYLFAHLAMGGVHPLLNDSIKYSVTLLKYFNFVNPVSPLQIPSY